LLQLKIKMWFFYGFTLSDTRMKLFGSSSIFCPLGVQRWSDEPVHQPNCLVLICMRKISWHWNYSNSHIATKLIQHAAKFAHSRTCTRRFRHDLEWPQHGRRRHRRRMNACARRGHIIIMLSAAQQVQANRSQVHALARSPAASNNNLSLSLSLLRPYAND